MEAQLVKQIEYKELNGASEMIEGCDKAVLTYILTEDMKLHKFVTFYEGSVFNFDQITPGHGWIVRENYKICMYRSFVYSFKNGIFSCIKHIKLYAVLLRDIIGFTPDLQNTHDLRNRSNKY